MATLRSKNYMAIEASASFSRPGNTTAYTAGDLVANSVTPGSVVPIEFLIPANVAFDPVAVKLQKSTASRTSASFRLHLLADLPTFVTAGDNDPMSTVVATGIAGLMQSFEGTLGTGFADGASGFLLPVLGLVVPVYKPVALGVVLKAYGLLEATAGYAPGSGETFLATLIARLP